MGSNVTIRIIKEQDIASTADVHKAAFPHQRDSENWINCNFRAFPRMQIFVAEHEGRVVGYILWTQKSGFRLEVVLELEQIAVHPKFQGIGIGETLIRTSLSEMEKYFQERNVKIKNIIVTTRTDNAAQTLYRKTLGAEVEAVIKNLYSFDEAFMIARKNEYSKKERR